MANYKQSASIRTFFSKGQPISYGKGEVILGNAIRRNGIYYISTGYVKVYSISDAGEEFLHIIYGSGEIFPLVWAYLGIELDHIFYEAISDCTVWKISQYWFNEYVSTNISLAHSLAMQLAEQFRMYIARVENLEYKKASQRVAYRLLLMAKRFGSQTDEGIAIDPQLTHEVFAHSINLTRESFSREIEKLLKDKIIVRIDRRIVIKDMQALEKRVGHPAIY